MKKKVVEIYASYNSIIEDGKRVRRMRRTQLSAQKIITNSLRRVGSFKSIKFIQSSKNSQQVLIRSLPKIQLKYSNNNKQQISKEQNKNDVKNEYFIKFSQSKQKNNNQYNNKNSQKYNNQKKNRQQYESNIQKKSQLNIYSNNTNILSRSSIDKNNNKNNNKNNYQNKNKIIINDYQMEKQLINKNIYKDKNKNIPHHQSNQNRKCSKCQNNKYVQYQDNSNYSNSKKNYNCTKIQDKFINKNKQSSGFDDLGEDFPKQIKDQLGQSNQNFSKFKFQNLQNQIIKSSSPQKQGWKDAIKTLTQLSQLSNNQNNPIQNPPNRATGSFVKSDPKLETQKQNTIHLKVQKYSWKHLPLSSKQQSHRPSKTDSMNDKIQIGSLINILQNIEVHQYFITLLSEYQQNIQKYIISTKQKQILGFLLLKKYYIQKNKMIQSLKGGKNIFHLPSIQIKDQHLKLYLQKQQIKKIIKDLELANNQLYTKLSQNYLLLHQKYKQNKYIALDMQPNKIQKQLIRILAGELSFLTQQKAKITEDNEEQKIQNIIFDTMQIIFLIAGLNGKKIKKIQFFQQIVDFQQYCTSNDKDIKQIIKYYQIQQ